MCVPTRACTLDANITVGQQPFPQTKVVDLFKVVLAVNEASTWKREPPTMTLDLRSRI